MSRKGSKTLKNFHKNVVANRKDFLESEVSKIEENIVQTHQQIKNLIEERAEFLEIFKEAQSA